MLIKAPLRHTNFYFGEIKEEEKTAIIIDDENFKINLYCSSNDAERLIQQLQRYVDKYKLKTIK